MKAIDFADTLTSCPACKEPILVVDIPYSNQFLPIRIAGCKNGCISLQRWETEPKLSLMREATFGKIYLDFYATRDTYLTVEFSTGNRHQENLQDEAAIALIRFEQ
jgi:hypothetical protein